MLRWYVLQSKPQKESFLNEQLCLRGIETYYPRLRVRPVNPRSRKVRSYFPGYLFIHIDLDSIGFSKIQWIPGVCRLVSCDGNPAFISDALLQTIRYRVDGINQVGAEKIQNFNPGDPVSILSGPFAGYSAIFDSRLKGSERVHVLLQMLQDRQLGVELSRGQIEKI